MKGSKYYFDSKTKRYKKVNRNKSFKRSVKVRSNNLNNSKFALDSLLKIVFVLLVIVFSTIIVISALKICFKIVIAYLGLILVPIFFGVFGIALAYAAYCVFKVVKKK